MSWVAPRVRTVTITESICSTVQKAAPPEQMYWNIGVLRLPSGSMALGATSGLCMMTSTRATLDVNGGAIPASEPVGLATMSLVEIARTSQTVLLGGGPACVTGRHGPA